MLNIFQPGILVKPVFATAKNVATAKTVAKAKAKVVTYVLSSPVSHRKIISVFSKNRNGRPHKGTDYVSKIGNRSVYAFYKGTLALKGYERTMGNYVVIKHTINKKAIYSTYMHLKSYLKISGAIKTGQKIGTMGNTGHSFGTHLHFQIGNSVPRLGHNVTFYNGDKMIANGFTFYNSERVITTKCRIIK
ncbi:MAG: M23 family metallopeptidase [Clostridia bacterium]